MRFFVDNNLPPRMARALSELVKPDHEVVHLRDKFAHDATDLEWIEQLGTEGGWIVITRDDAITRKPQERDALARSGLSAFFLAGGWKHLEFWNVAWNLVRWWPDILRQSELVAPGATFLVPVKHSGKFKQI